MFHTTEYCVSPQKGGCSSKGVKSQRGCGKPVWEPSGNHLGTILEQPKARRVWSCAPSRPSLVLLWLRGRTQNVVGRVSTASPPHHTQDRTFLRAQPHIGVVGRRPRRTLLGTMLGTTLVPDVIQKQWGNKHLDECDIFDGLLSHYFEVY